MDRPAIGIRHSLYTFPNERRDATSRLSRLVFESPQRRFRELYRDALHAAKGNSLLS